MFEALGYEMVADHVDLTFRDPSRWPKVGEGDDMPPSLFVAVGDPETGGNFQMVVVPPVPSDLILDTHYHGSDQFRAVIKGCYRLHRRQLEASQFGYQVSGVPYREGIGASKEELWLFAAHGARRGARATMIATDGNFQLPDIGEDQLDRPVPSPDDPYWQDVRGGSKGTIGLKSTLGRPVGGFNWGSFGTDQGWQEISPGISVTAGLIGDDDSGPLILTVRGGAKAELFPSTTSETEIIVAVMGGSCRIGDRSYETGEVRVQKAGVPLDGAQAGLEGAEIVLMIADRRHIPETAESRKEDSLDDWQSSIEKLVAGLRTPAVPVPAH